MIGKAFELMSRYRELLLYGVFGALTTVVNFVVYVLCMAAFSGKYSNIAATAVAWVIAVLFAYFTNRIWVFQSKAGDLKSKLRECAAFFASRLLSGLIDLAIMYAAVDLMRFDGKIVKLLSNVLVIIINYVFSKFFIFNPAFLLKQKEKQAKEKYK